MSTPVLEAITTWRGTVIDVRHLTPGQRFTIGGDGADLGVQHPALPPHPHPIARIDAEGHARVDLCPGLTAAVLVDGRIEQVDRPGGLRLLPGRKARVEVDALAMLFSVVPAAPALPPGRPALVERGSRRALAFAAAVHAALLVIAFSAPVQAGRLALDRLDHDDRWIAMEVIPTQEKAPIDLFTPAPRDETGEGGDALAQQVPAPRSQRSDAVEPAARSTETVAQRKAVAKAAADEVASALDDVFDGADPVGAETQAALNGLFGTRDGTQGALVAMGGLRGAGVAPRGAGFDGGGSVSVATRTRGRGTDPRYGAGAARPLPPKGEKVPKVIPRTPVVVGGLDKDEIARVVRRNRGAVRHCYDRALQTRPDLEGKAVVEFVVGPTGEVIRARLLESTLGDPEVGACLAEKIERWQFPRVEGGGVVVVKYPFLFRAG